MPTMVPPLQLVISVAPLTKNQREAFYRLLSRALVEGNPPRASDSELSGRKLADPRGTGGGAGSVIDNYV